MDFNEMKEDARSRSNFVKLERDVPTRVKFLSADFKKVEKDFGNGPIVKYELPCLINGEEKLYQGSARFYEELMTKATNRNRNFKDLTYIITKKGEGLNTTYDKDVADSSDMAEPVPPQAPQTKEVPF